MHINPSPRATRANRVKSAFTLIELLVVIAIIAILAAILFPVFGRARENARRSSCQSNLKQIGLGIVQYTQDYDEKFAPGLGNDWSATSWAVVVQPYMKSLQVFRCPSSSQGTYGQPWASADWAGVPIDYASNGYIRWNGSQNVLGGVMGIPDTPPMGKSLAAMNRPADTILVTEKHNDRINNTTGWFGANLSGFGPGPVFDNNWTGATAGLIPNPGRAGNFPEGPDGAVVARHFDTANFLFVDGHVKAMRPTATNQNGNNMWDADRS
jgi:prepilin-type N-terminal cleavage/methylation domain-containing protein/prepilin-type processing-associated H-X9-DG protein